MEMIKRRQVTEVITKRQVSHEVKMGNTNFVRYEKITSTMPYMDCNVIITKSSIEWNRRNGNVLTKLSKKDVELLALEIRFNMLDINTKNGNS